MATATALQVPRSLNKRSDLPTTQDNLTSIAIYYVKPIHKHVPASLVLKFLITQSTSSQGKEINVRYTDCGVLQQSLILHRQKQLECFLNHPENNYSEMDVYFVVTKGTENIPPIIDWRGQLATIVDGCFPSRILDNFIEIHQVEGGRKSFLTQFSRFAWQILT
jgi:hypothetical protein